MSLIVELGAVAGGISLGGGLGYAVGRRVLGNWRLFWRALAIAMFVCLGVDLAGLFVGQTWIALGSLGLMAGSLTGLKYGGIEAVRFWELPAASAAEAHAEKDAPTPEAVDANV